MVKITGQYQGGLHCALKHEPSQTTINTDAPADIGGRAQSFSPTDLVAAALVSCIATTLAVYGKRHGWDLTGMHFEVVKAMAESPNRMIKHLPVNIWMPLDFPQETRLICEKVAHSCPVHKSLHPDIEAPIIFHWPHSPSSTS